MRVCLATRSVRSVHDLSPLAKCAMHAEREDRVLRYSQSGSHPPRQYEPVPQNPYSEQQGAEAGQLIVALQVD